MALLAALSQKHRHRTWLRMLLATKANLEEHREMLVTARDRSRKLHDEGKTEQEVADAKPLADLDPK